MKSKDTQINTGAKTWHYACTLEWFQDFTRTWTSIKHYAVCPNNNNRMLLPCAKNFTRVKLGYFFQLKPGICNLKSFVYRSESKKYRSFAFLVNHTSKSEYCACLSYYMDRFSRWHVFVYAMETDSKLCCVMWSWPRVWHRAKRHKMEKAQGQKQYKPNGWFSVQQLTTSEVTTNSVVVVLSWSTKWLLIERGWMTKKLITKPNVRVKNMRQKININWVSPTKQWAPSWSPSAEQFQKQRYKSGQRMFCLPIVRLSTKLLWMWISHLVWRKLYYLCFNNTNYSCSQFSWRASTLPSV